MRKVHVAGSRIDRGVRLSVGRVRRCAAVEREGGKGHLAQGKPPERKRAEEAERALREAKEELARIEALLREADSRG